MTFRYSTIAVNSTQSGCFSIRLNRPEVHNAFNEDVIIELDDVLGKLENNVAVRALSLLGNGPSFCAGADLKWMKRAANYDEKKNYEDALRFARMLNRLYRFPCPTIAVAQGSVFGGGVGLVAACDFTITSDDAVFSLSEVKLGLIPSVIAPYVVEAIGSRQARRLFLTGERFGAEKALDTGLAYTCTPPQELESAHAILLKNLLRGSPAAQRKSKHLVQTVLAPINSEVIKETAKRIAEIRSTPEAGEGIKAFFERRPPYWIPSDK